MNTGRIAPRRSGRAGGAGVESARTAIAASIRAVAARTARPGLEPARVESAARGFRREHRSSLFPANSGTPAVKPQAIEALVQQALRTTTKDAKSVSNAVAKLLPEKLQAFANETKGLPKLAQQPELQARPAAGVAGFERTQLDETVKGIQLHSATSCRRSTRSRTRRRSRRSSAPCSMPSIRGALLRASRWCRPRATCSSVHERSCAIVPSICGRGLNLAPPTLFEPLLRPGRRHRPHRGADARDGGQCADAGRRGSGATLLDISVQELRVRADQVLRSLDRLAGTEENAYNPDADLLAGPLQHAARLAQSQPGRTVPPVPGP